MQAPLPPQARGPSARARRMQRITGQIHPLAPAKTFRSDAAVSDDFLANKRDKRLIKHSSFVSRIQSARVSKSQKRRRPKNKLAASLDSLADALPDLDDNEGGKDALAGKIGHKSLRSKKGALKRKERIVKGEMDRFGVSMAKLSETAAAKDKDAAAKSKEEPAPQGTANRWAALRGYISATMEQNPAFAK